MFENKTEAEMAPAEAFITVEVEGAEREIHMTFGLLNEVTRLIGDPANAVAVYYNPAVREVLILALLAERDKRGKITKSFEALEEIEISMANVELVLAWGVDHALDFFARSMKRVLAAKPRLEGLGVLTSSLNGSPASLSKKGSAGRTK